MKQLLLIIFLGITTLLQAQREKVIAYVTKYKDLAIEEMRKTGVPASITLAQGILESQSGESDLAKGSNNHFGIKCKTEWTGPKTYHDDDEKKECFRVYASAEESYHDHSIFLRTRDPYQFLFKLDKTDDSGWAYGLKKAGYATEKDYPIRLLNLINDYELHQYSVLALQQSTTTTTSVDTGKKYKVINQTNAENEIATTPIAAAPIAETTIVKKSIVETPIIEKEAIKETPTKLITAIEKEDTTEVEKTLVSVPEIIETKKTSPYPTEVFTINHAKVIYATAGTSLLSIANKYGISLSKLFMFNELKEIDILETNQLLFLETKLKKGATDFHIVTNNETLANISQTEGIRLESLLEYNQLKKEQTVNIGEKLLLRAPTSPSKKPGNNPKK
jgi:LysM repeat protein